VRTDKFIVEEFYNPVGKLITRKISKSEI